MIPYQELSIQGWRQSFLSIAAPGGSLLTSQGQNRPRKKVFLKILPSTLILCKFPRTMTPRYHDGLWKSTKWQSHFYEKSHPKEPQSLSREIFMHREHWHFIIWLQLVGYYSLTHLITLKYTWVLIFSLAIETTELPCNPFHPVFFFPQLSNILSIYFSPPSLPPMFFRNQVRARCSTDWSEDMRDATARDGGLARAVKSLKKGSHFRMLRADRQESRNMQALHLQDVSDLFNHSAVSGSLRPHGLQRARLPCPSPSLEVWLNSCPLSRWSHPTISSSVASFSPCLLFPRIRVFSNESALRIRWPSIGASASASVLPMNIQGWSPLGWTGWISLHSKGLSRVFSNTTVQKH